MRMTFSRLAPGATYSLQLLAVDGAGKKSAWSKKFGFTTESDTTPPPVPSIPILFARLGTITITWDGLGSLGEQMPYDFKWVEVHASTTGGFTPDSTTMVATCDAKAGAVVADLIYNTMYYFRLVAVDTWDNKSLGSAEASAIVKPLVNLDLINAELNGAMFAGGAIKITDMGLGSIGALQLVDGSVAVTKLDSGVITSISTAQGTANSKNRTYIQTAQPTGGTYVVGDIWIDTTLLPPNNLPGNVLKTWNGTSWLPRPPIIPPSGNGIYYQIAAPTGGTYAAGDTWFDTHDGNKAYKYVVGTGWVAYVFGSSAIEAGAIIAGKIAAGTIVAADIATDTITATQISANAITASELAAGAVIAGKITAGTIVAADIAAGAIGANEIAANAITAGKILAGAITAGKIAALSIAAGDIQANAITADKIEAGAITAVKINAYAIDGMTITGAKMYAGLFRSSYSTGYIEIGDTGVGDPVDEIRMFNSYTVSSIRNPSSSPGSIRFGLGDGSSIDMGSTTDGHRAIKIGYIMVKGLAASYQMQVRNVWDTDYANVMASGFTVASSLTKLKNNITPVGVNTSEELKKNGVSEWEWKNPQTKPGKHYGLIADEMPIWMRDGDGYSINGVVAFLWESVKQSNERIAVLEGKVKP